MQIGGTSVSSPCFAGLVAVANQLRVSQGLGLGTLDGSSQTLPTLYSIDAADFHDIVTGNNGYAAGLGYDLVTGLGSPIANKLMPDLALYPTGTVTNPATTVSLAASTYAPQYSQPITFAATVGETDMGAAPPTGTVTFKDGGTVIGTGTLSRGMALFTDSSLALGSHTITAVYGGDATFTGSTSSSLIEVVTPVATMTSLSDSARSITYGQSETFTATVSDLVSGAADADRRHGHVHGSGHVGEPRHGHLECGHGVHHDHLADRGHAWNHCHVRRATAFTFREAAGVFPWEP